MLVYSTRLDNRLTGMLSDDVPGGHGHVNPVEGSRPVSVCENAGRGVLGLSGAEFERNHHAGTAWFFHGNQSRAAAGRCRASIRVPKSAPHKEKVKCPDRKTPLPR